MQTMVRISGKPQRDSQFVVHLSDNDQKETYAHSLDVCASSSRCSHSVLEIFVFAAGGYTVMSAPPHVDFIVVRVDEKCEENTRAGVKIVRS